MSIQTQKLSTVFVPSATDYIGIYLTNRCFLSCPYCITNHNEQYINQQTIKELDAFVWVDALNRLELPSGIPLTFQGGEPFLHKGIWKILENVKHKVDILTALPPYLTVEHFRNLQSLQWNKRKSPYPTIRVSYHQGQNDYRDLIDRIKILQEFLSIGLFHIEHPDNVGLTEEIRAYARQQGVEFRTKEFLGKWKGKVYGHYKYPESCQGKVLKAKVLCRNTVYPIAPDGTIYRCHSDLYADRKEFAVGKLTDPDLRLDVIHTKCHYYGTCSPCDVKIKTNHLQQDGYTSVDIILNDEKN